MPRNRSEKTTPLTRALLELKAVLSIPYPTEHEGVYYIRRSNAFRNVELASPYIYRQLTHISDRLRRRLIDGWLEDPRSLMDKS